MKKKESDGVQYTPDEEYECYLVEECINVLIEELEEIFGRIHTMKEIKEYAMECFDDVLEKYEMEKEILEKKYRNKK